MPQEANLQKAARDILDSALRAADAGRAIKRTIRLSGSILRICDTTFDISSQPIYVVAIGKVAPAMAVGLAEILGDRIGGAVISGPATGANTFESSGWKIFQGGHPLPNEQSLEAARFACDLLRRAEGERALMVFLISGGGSAMMESPRDSRITLADLQEVNRVLVTCGASIAEVNAVRRAFSAVKGGKLAALAPHAEQLTLIISDTNRGDEASVASGPSLRPSADVPKPTDVVDRYGLGPSLPMSILEAVRDYKVEKPRAARDTKHWVIADSQLAVEAAAAKAHELDFIVEIAPEINEQAIGHGCQLLLSRLLALRKKAPRDKSVCLISGGEFSCPVRGTGVGGRNSETALRLAIDINVVCRRGESALQHFLIMSAGTDGRDGNSPAAGATVDETTIPRALSQGIDPGDSLLPSDAFNFFSALDDTIVTGPTNTNVRDLRILIAGGTM